jgi:hypothetical protein
MSLAIRPAAAPDAALVLATAARGRSAGSRRASTMAGLP